MAGNGMIEDHISPIIKILKGDYTDKKERLRNFVYHSRKINNRHLRKHYTIEQTVEKLLDPGWIKKVRRFNPEEWQAILDMIWKRAAGILGKIPRPEVVLYPAFNSFNGRVYKVDNYPVIGCSPDFPHTTGINLKVLLAHEYAHFIRWRKTGIPTENVPIYALIYEEGWATWLSIKILPELNLNRLFMSNLHKAINMPDPEGGYLRWCAKNLDKIAGRAQKVLKSKSRRELGRFFQCKRYWGEKSPIRVGYYLGYRLIDMLSEGMTSRELLCIKPTPKKTGCWLSKLVDDI